MRPTVLAAVALAASAGGAHAQTNAASGSPFRYDDDPLVYARAHPNLYERLKYLALGPGTYLSLGADLRERVEADDEALLGFRSKVANVYDLHRLLVFADLQLGPDLRTFVQFGNHDEAGRLPAALPTDVNRLDVTQAFVDGSRSFGEARLTLRLGRAEMSFDDGALIGLRDGPNVRQSWDGVRAILVDGPWRWDGFGVEPVGVKPGVFEDGPVQGQSLEGVHVTFAPKAPLAADAFFYENDNPDVSLYGAAGSEHSSTSGLRLRGGLGALDGSVGAIGQTGTANHRPVRAFALHGDFGWRVSHLPWSPHVTFRTDVLSGGDPAARTVGTFNALYPNVAYSTEATIEAPANLVQCGVVAAVQPTRALLVTYTLESLWRYTRRDAFYAAPLFPLVRPTAPGDRYSGNEQQLEGALRLNEIVSLKAAYVHFTAGGFVRRGGGSDENFAMTSLSFRL